MKHPFDSLPVSVRKPSFWTFLILTVMLAAVMQVVGALLKTDVAPALFNVVFDWARSR